MGCLDHMESGGAELGLCYQPLLELSPPPGEVGGETLLNFLGSDTKTQVCFLCF